MIKGKSKNGKARALIRGNSGDILTDLACLSLAIIEEGAKVQDMTVEEVIDLHIAGLRLTAKIEEATE